MSVLPKKSLRYIPAPNKYLAVRKRNPKPLKWTPSLLTFVLIRMAELVQKGLDIEKGNKEKHMDQIAANIL